MCCNPCALLVYYHSALPRAWRRSAAGFLFISGKEPLMAVRAIPEGYHTVTPNIVVRDARKAIDFYMKAFGAAEIMAMSGPGGKIMHAELQIGNSRIMLADEMPDWGCKSPQALSGSPVSFYVYVEKVDAAWKRAV